MNKKKIGVYSYYASIIISIIALILVMFLIKIDDNNMISVYRYMTCYFCFGVVIPIGTTIREFLVCEYVKKKMIIKIVVISVVLVVGIIGIMFIDNATIGLVMFLLSLLALSFVIVPSAPKKM